MFVGGHEVALWLTVSMDTNKNKTVFHTCWSCDNKDDVQIKRVVYKLPTYLAYRLNLFYSSRHNIVMCFSYLKCKV